VQCIFYMMVVPLGIKRFRQHLVNLVIQLNVQGF
jgi:hypothetical protein